MRARRPRLGLPRRPPARDDRGVVAIIVAVFVVLLLVLTAVAIDTGRWYLEASRVQNAADAAALAGVTSMPTDFALATTNARAASSKNGFPNSGSSAVTAFQTGRRSELGVTVTSTIDNVFGGFFGNDSTTISRTAVADYQGAAIMGSPCNTFGNEPNSTTQAPPSGTTIPTVAQGGYATCQSRSPNFWAAIAGPTTVKGNGDRYSTVACGSSTDGCSGTVNNEYDEQGYYFIVRVGPQAAGDPITLQLYDPAYVSTGFACENLPGSGMVNGMNVYAPDAATRYDNSANAFCTGDGAPGGASNTTGGNTNLVTSFVLRRPTATQNPALAEVDTNCVAQFGSQTSAPTVDQLTNGDSSYRPHLAQVFHNWVNLCTFTPPAEGDYYLQVRTSASTSGATAVAGGGSNTLMWRGGTNAYSDTATQTTGGGNNMFGMRAFVGSSASQPNALSADVSVAGWERMPMFQNVASGSTFNLLQVKPNASGKSFFFDLFDVGDGSTGTVTVNPPSDATYVNGLGQRVALTGSVLTGCQYLSQLGDTTWAAANLNGLCRFSTSGGNGRVIELEVPIPTGYDCNGTSPGGCWFTVTVNWSGSPTDFTTWNAFIGGDSLRLVE